MRTKNELSEEVTGLRKQVADLREAAVVRRRVEDALRDASERYRAFLDETALPLARLDADGRVVVASLAFARRLGYPTRRALYEASGQRTIFGTLAAWPALVACLVDVPDLRLETPLTTATADTVEFRLRAIRDADGVHVTLELDPPPA